jgi:hypothetical protein
VGALRPSARSLSTFVDKFMRWRAMRAASNDAEQKLTLWEAIKDLAWFTQTFRTAVGAPPILPILQMIMHRQLVSALQWGVEGYHRTTAVMAAIVEPIFAPVLAWINPTLGWHLALYPHWRPLLLIGMVSMTARAKGAKEVLWEARHG